MRIKAHRKHVGANAVEYGLVMAIIVALMIGAAQTMNTPIKDFFVKSADCVAGLVHGNGCSGSIASSNPAHSPSDNSASSLVGATATGTVNLGGEPMGASASFGNENSGGGGFPLGAIVPSIPFSDVIDVAGDLGSGALDLAGAGVDAGTDLVAAGIRLDGDIRGEILNGGIQLAGAGVDLGLGLTGDGIGLLGDVANTGTDFAADGIRTAGGIADRGTDILGAGIEGLGNISDNGSQVVGDITRQLPIPGSDLIGSGIEGAGDFSNWSSEVASDGIEAAGDLTNSGSQVIGDGVEGAGNLADRGSDFINHGTDVVGDLANETSDVVGEAVALLPITESEIIASAIEGNGPVEALGSDRVAEQAGEALIELVGPGYIIENELRGNDLERKPLSDLNLTSDQTDDLETIFGDNLDLTKVEVIEGEGGILEEALEGRPLVAGNTILLNGLDPHASPEAWAEFVHELVHVWQFQNGGADYASQAVHAQQLGEGYNVARAIDGSSPVQFISLNPEQQAELILAAQDTGYLSNPSDQEIFIRVLNPNSSSGYESGFESDVVASTDVAAISSLEADGWINATSTVDDGLAVLGN